VLELRPRPRSYSRWRDQSNTTVLQTLRKQWRDLASAQPGHRFQSHYRREHQKSGGTNRPWKLIVGIALIVVGVVLMFLPGPGVVFLALGGAFLAGESQVVARALDRFELYALRLFAKIKRQWQHTSLPGKVLAAVVLVAIVGAAARFLWIKIGA
jgi:uncharacterized membrane protein YbaN (DUF454 family)